MEEVYSSEFYIIGHRFEHGRSVDVFFHKTKPSRWNLRKSLLLRLCGRDLKHYFPKFLNDKEIAKVKVTIEFLKREPKQPLTPKAGV